MSIATLEREAVNTADGRCGAFVRTRYHEGFVAELKALVPPDCRSWDPDARVWFLEEDYADQVEDLVARTFGEVLVTHGGGESDYIRTRTGEISYQESLF